jgi:hypothetical protein
LRKATRHKIPRAPCPHFGDATPYPVRVLDRVPRPRRVRAATLLLATALAASVVLAAVPATAKPRKPVVKITVGDITVYKVGNDPQTIPDDVRTKILAAVSTYVNAATVKPLQTGAVDDAALATTLGPAATQRAAGLDRVTLVDEGIPKAKGRIRVNTLPVKLTALADASGRIVVVTAVLDSIARTRTAKGAVTISRKGELVFTPEGDTWKIDGYDLAVERSGKGLGLSTTATTAVPGTPATGAAK